MRDCQQYPKLRYPLEAHFEKINGQPCLLLRCPLGLSPAPLALIPAVAPVLQCCDGLTSRDQIIERFQSQGLTAELLQQFLDLLDQHLFLDNPRFAKVREETLQAFAASPVRAAALAGIGYPAAPPELENFVDALLKLAPPFSPPPDKRLLALVAPHIDFQRGAKGYAHSYQALVGQDAEIFVLFGTGHQYSDKLFHLCAKDFATPLGTVSCDLELVQEIAGAYGVERSFADQFLHKQEHSLEYQLPFIKRLLPQAKIVPILVGSFYEFLAQGQSPKKSEAYQSFIQTLSLSLAKRLKKNVKISFIAGVDLAHVGRHFGDAESLSETGMAAVRSADLAFLEAFNRQDLEAVWEHVAATKDARHLCGFPAMYTLLDVLANLGSKLEGRILTYEQAVNYQNDCAVTFAGVGLFG